METNKDAFLKSSLNLHAMDTRSKSKYQMESIINAVALITTVHHQQLMTLQRQKIKGFSFEKCLWMMMISLA